MTEIKNALRQADNKVVIKGKLKEKKLSIGSKDGKNYIKGHIIVRENESEHKVSVLCNELTKSGTPNGYFKGLVTVMNEYKSIAEFGEEMADVVSIDRGTIGINDFVTQDGQLVSNVEVSANSIHRVTEDVQQMACAEIEVYMDKIKMEINREQMPTGRILIDAVIPCYGGRITPVQLVAEGEQRVNYIQEHVANGERTFKLIIGLVNKPKTIQTDSQDVVLQSTNCMMGDAVPSHITAALNEKTVGRVREYQVLNGEAYPVLSAKNYATENIEQGKEERKAMLAEKERKSQSQPSAMGSAMPSANMMNFGTQMPMGGVPTANGPMSHF